MPASNSSGMRPAMTQASTQSPQPVHLDRSTLRERVRTFAVKLPMGTTLLAAGQQRLATAGRGARVLLWNATDGRSAGVIALDGAAGLSEGPRAALVRLSADDASLLAIAGRNDRVTFATQNRRQEIQRRFVVLSNQDFALGPHPQEPSMATRDGRRARMVPHGT